MIKLHAHHDIGASRDIIWGLLMDFGNIEAWWPKNGPVHIERVEIEGSGPGMVRYMHNAGFDNPVAERLDDLDLENYYHSVYYRRSPSWAPALSSKGTAYRTRRWWLPVDL